MKRTALRRRKPLRRTSFRRRSPMRRRSPRTRRQSTTRDPDYLAWLRRQPCRAHACDRRPCDPHHARHDATGASVGAHLKDDSRAISLCRKHHRELESLSGAFRGWTREDVRRWLDRQILDQRMQYLGRDVMASRWAVSL